MKKDKAIYVVQEGVVWSALQSAVHNAVGQVIALVRDFNWCEPYKNEDFYESYASGFFIDNEGHFVTNFHIVENAHYIWIHIPVLGKQKCEARIVGVCPERDIALLKITDEALQLIKNSLGEVSFVPLGNSDAVQRADSILVLGYPLGQYNLKSTTGVISGQEFIENSSLLQMTAPVNPGSSGGPLFSAAGVVVGIAVAMIPSAQNVGYAIAINELHLILDDLKKKKLVRKLFFGVRFSYANDEKAEFLNNPLPAGLYITAVIPGTMADHAGVRVGDMLYGIGDCAINCYGEIKVPWSIDYISFAELMSRMRIGDEVPFVIYRNGERKDIVCVMKESVPFAIRKRFPDYEPIEYEVFAGMVIMELSEDHIELLVETSPDLLQFRFPEKRVNSVLVVTHIIPHSYVYQLAMIPLGTIITQVNGKPIATLEDLRVVIKKEKKEQWVTLMTSLGALMVLSWHKIYESDKSMERLGIVRDFQME